MNTSAQLDRLTEPHDDDGWSPAMEEACRLADEAGRREIAGAAEAQIAMLEALSGSLPEEQSTEALRALRRAAHDLSGLGGAVGSPLLGQIAASLSHLVDRVLSHRTSAVTPLRRAAITMHVRQLRQIQSDGRGDGCEAKLVAGLRAVAEKASA